MDRPIVNSYCVLTDKVYAGEYAGDLHNPEGKVKSLMDFGITHFIDLTEENELAPYSQYLSKDCVHYRFPICDVSIPDECESVYVLMQYIDTVLTNSDNMIYIHCWGGVGRTGIIVGCYYVYHGETYEQALIHLRESFKQCPKSERRKTPETSEQEDFIRKFFLFMESVEKFRPADGDNLSLRKKKTPISVILGKIKMLKSYISNKNYHDKRTNTK